MPCTKHLVISHESGLDQLIENQACTLMNRPGFAGGSIPERMEP